MRELQILIVEDDFLIAQNMIEELNTFGYQTVFHAAESKTAIEIINREKIDLALFDVMLEDSEIDGIEIAEYLKKRISIPIIFLTALGDKKTLERAMKLAPSNYLIKPHRAEQLEIAIEIALANFSKDNSPHIGKISETESGNPPIIQKGDILWVKDNRKFLRFPVADICRIESSALVSEFYTDEKKSVFSFYLKDFQAHVSHPDLRRIHRSHIINAQKIISVSSGQIILQVGEKKVELPIGGSAYKENLSDIIPPFQ